MNNIDRMLIKIKDYPALYNKVANWLYKTFEISSAEVSAIITCYLIDHMKEDEDDN